ncbi:MAG: cytochrome c oxidase subunit II [bacterium]
MDVHYLEKIWIVAAVFLILTFIGTVTYGALGPGVRMVSNEGGIVPEPSKPVESSSFKEPGVYKTGVNTYDVYVLARQFVYRPRTITLPANSTVTFHLTSPDVIHGFELAGTNVNTMAIPGRIGKFTVKFDEVEDYGLICHEYCGVGHHLMEGKVEVVPKSEFESREESS